MTTSAPAGSIDFESLLNLMQTRRSVRAFRLEPLPKGALEQLIEAARAAPSASNRQAYRFLAVSSPERIDQMRLAIEAAAQRASESMAAANGATFAQYATYFTRFVGAPVVLAPIYRVDSTRVALGPEQAAMATISAVSSVAASVMNLLLAAHSLGLGACWMTGPLLAGDKLAELLEVPKGWQLAALIPVGYAAETPKAPERRSVETLLRRIA